MCIVLPGGLSCPLRRPDRYVPLFGSEPYDIAQERPDDIPFEEQLEGLQAVIKAGKVRYVGVSNETSYGVSEMVHIAKANPGLPKIVSIQNCYRCGAVKPQTPTTAGAPTGAPALLS